MIHPPDPYVGEDVASYGRRIRQWIVDSLRDEGLNVQRCQCGRLIRDRTLCTWCEESQR